VQCFTGSIPYHSFTNINILFNLSLLSGPLHSSYHIYQDHYTAHITLWSDLFSHSKNPALPVPDKNTVMISANRTLNEWIHLVLASSMRTCVLLLGQAGVQAVVWTQLTPYHTSWERDYKLVISQQLQSGPEQGLCDLSLKRLKGLCLCVSVRLHIPSWGCEIGVRTCTV
jgi:hypothetical protein